MVGGREEDTRSLEGAGEGRIVFCGLMWWDGVCVGDVWGGVGWMSGAAAKGDSIVSMALMKGIAP